MRIQFSRLVTCTLHKYTTKYFEKHILNQTLSLLYVDFGYYVKLPGGFEIDCTETVNGF